MLLYFGSITMLPASKPFVCDIDHRDPVQYVSRGGIKLANALSASRLDVSGRGTLDVGASTGGFIDCLLKHGAERAIAVDVGYGQLAWSLRTDPRVTVLERTNARYLTPEMLPFVPDLATIDVSFISLTLILPAVLACLKEPYDVLALVKPQFEVGRELASKGRGVIRDPDDRRDALLRVGRFALGLGCSVLSYHPSGLPGPKGNRETFIHLAGPGARSHARTGAQAAYAEDKGRAEDELLRMAYLAEPEQRRVP